jgi:hypothetical protein
MNQRHVKIAPLQGFCPEGARWLPLARCATYKFKRGYLAVAIRLIITRVKLSNDAGSARNEARIGPLDTKKDIKTTLDR